MRQADVKVGGIYTAKVSSRIVPVKITKDLGTAMDYNQGHERVRARHAGWEATNCESGRQIRIRSAARLRGEWRKPRCGTCANCVTAVEERSAFIERFQRSTTQAEKVTLRDGWRYRAAELPCMTNTKEEPK